MPIKEVPLTNSYITTDKQRRIRLSADVVHEYELTEGNRVKLGYDSDTGAIAIKPATTDIDPTAGRIDKRGYIPAGKFFSRTRIVAESRKYAFAYVEGDWLVFVAERGDNPI